jgi:hypothetical protein
MQWEGLSQPFSHGVVDSALSAACPLSRMLVGGWWMMGVEVEVGGTCGGVSG